MEKIQFWEDREKKLVHIKLLSEVADKFARKIAEDNKRNKKMNKRTQIRKFYDEVSHLNMEARELEPDDPDYDRRWNAILALVNMLVAKAAYARGRELISGHFLAFIKDSVLDIEEKDDLKVFGYFFEAFMGFYKLRGPKT
ncbi:CRISPR type III-A/MTUBE-associated protein Csm2 [Candidatus Desulfarcum epimagneticum]|uniref:CRISPR system Cms protein Csm2 n=1 Tax=uncultured Desulfobacteraceae bacterium TaxID=218296 RepID=A0A484HFA8_9BACT|nr:CRISPR type III-A/MTUBE-associated protein Csm2 [uncultured Desulfobacteraceae bacterium]